KPEALSPLFLERRRKFRIVRLKIGDVRLKMRVVRLKVCNMDLHVRDRRMALRDIVGQWRARVGGHRCGSCRVAFKLHPTIPRSRKIVTRPGEIVSGASPPARRAPR